MQVSDISLQNLILTAVRQLCCEPEVSYSVRLTHLLMVKFFFGALALFVGGTGRASDL